MSSASSLDNLTTSFLATLCTIRSHTQQLKIPKDKFCDTMKVYALKSKISCVPDFEQIWHHMKDRAYVVK